MSSQCKLLVCAPTWSLFTSYLMSSRLGIEFQIGTLKETMILTEVEKNARLLQCQQLLNQKTKLKAEVSKAFEDVNELFKQALKAGTEVEYFKIEVSRLDADSEAGILLFEYA
uniref:Uncharacterized protein n=1 Tax=Kalanchoe fedtschenkoi TaxID=63787 RepID=A0A7N0T9V0_KALFE